MTLLPQLERELLAAHERRRARAGRRLRRRTAGASGRPGGSGRRGAWLATGLGRAVPVAAVAVAIAVVAVAVVLGGSHAERVQPSTSVPPGTIVLKASSTTGGAPSPADLARAAATLRRRLHAVAPGARVTRAGDSLVVGGVPPAQEQAILQLSAPGRLAFFDWEADVLMPGGQTVAARLAATAADPAALQISQGAAQGPGYPGAGGLSLYAAVSLAARQPAAPDAPSLSRRGSRYYLFGTPGSRACAAAAAAGQLTIPAGEHCLLAGPAPSIGELDASLPSGIPASAGRRLRVPQGTVVLQAVDPDPAHPVSSDSPSARFYVLRDRPFAGGRELTNPRPSTDTAGSPDVAFGFTDAGRTSFQRATARLSVRGAQVSTPGQTEYQHFAVALDGRLLEVAFVSFRTYPEGVQTGTGVLVGDFTPESARIVSALLRYGPLPLTLAPR